MCSSDGDVDNSFGLVIILRDKRWMASEIDGIDKMEEIPNIKLADP